jgi:hypothetical protein
MQPNYAALKAAMATGGQYAGMTDAAVLSAVNAATVTQAVDIPISAVTQALALGTTTISQASLWGFANGVYENDLIAARALS